MSFFNSMLSSNFLQIQFHNGKANSSSISLPVALQILCVLFFSLSACGVKEPLKVPDFSTVYFTGNAMVSKMPMPIQGAFTKRDSELKFVLTAQQGVLLGYGKINPENGDVDVLFSQSGTKKLLEKTGESLVDLLPLLIMGKGTINGWTCVEPGGKMSFKNPHLELTAYKEDTKK